MNGRIKNLTRAVLLAVALGGVAVTTAALAQQQGHSSGHGAGYCGNGSYSGNSGQGSYNGNGSYSGNGGYAGNGGHGSYRAQNGASYRGDGGRHFSAPYRGGWAAPRAYGYPWHGYYPRHRYVYSYYAPPVIGYYAPRYYDIPAYVAPAYSVEYVEPPTVYYRQAPRLAQASPPPPAPPVAPAPQPTPAPRTFERYTLSAQELFAFDRSELRLPQPKLDEIAAALVGNPQIANVQITGYTDRLGSDAYNQRLSQRRADAVKAYLVQKGVAATRLSAVGRGKANPVVNCNDKNRAQLIKCLEPNRRVEVEQITIERQR